MVKGWRAKLIAVLIFMGVSAAAQAETKDVDALIRFLHERFPDSYQVVSAVEEQVEDRLAFPVKGAPPERGRELLVLTGKEGAPVYLQPQAAVIRVESTFEGKALAQRMASLGDPVRLGDPVVLPASPVIYVYTNLEWKDDFPVYKELLRKLLEANYEVVELSGDRLEPRTDRYGVLLRLEGAPDHLVLKVRSIYSGDTFFSSSWKYAGEIRTREKPGEPLEVARAERPTASFAAPPEPSRPPAPARTFQQAAPPADRERYELDESFNRLVVCDLQGDGEEEAVLLDDEGLEAFRMASGSLRSLARFPFSRKNVKGLHLHAADLDGKGGEELLVTLGEEVRSAAGEDTVLRSMVLTFDGGQWSALAANLPYYLRVVEDREGRPVVLAQKKGRYEPYEGDILQLKWDEGRREFLPPREYEPAHNIYSVYQFNLIPDDPGRVIILEPTGFVHVYTVADEAVDAVSDSTYGNYREIPYRMQIERERYIGGFDREDSRFAYAPVRFALERSFDDQSFLIRKGRSAISVTSSLGTLMDTRRGKDALAAVKWTGKQIQESWQSAEVARDILDFTFAGRGPDSRIVLLVRDNRGYALEWIH